MLLGVIALAAGYFNRSPWQSYLGLGGMILGYGIVILDLFKRKKGRDAAAGFYTAATMAPIFALTMLLLVTLIAALVLAVQSARHGFSATHAIRLLHFLGILFAFAIVSGIPAVALKATQEKQNDEGEE